MSHLKVAKLSALGQIIRVLSGPIVLLFIGVNLSNDEKALYFTFFNIIALQQVLELGVGYTSKQYISHSLGHGHVITDKSFDYVIFSIIWFAIISLVMLLGVGGGGMFFFSSYDGQVAWQGPWVILIVVSSLSALFIPLQISLEGAQNQELVYFSKLISTTMSTVTTIITLNVGFGLYSPSCGLIVGFFCQNVILLNRFTKVFQIPTLKEKLPRFCFRTVFLDLFPLLSKVSITWLLGYALWNSFNLIAFKTLSMEDCALLGMTLALCRAGYSIADSLVSSQLTIFGHEISKGRVRYASKLFLRYLSVSVLILILGYSLFLFIVFYINAFDLKKFILPFKLTIILMFFSLLILLVSTQNNFCRCFKIDPNFINSLFLNCSVPVVCYFSFRFYNTPDSSLLVIVAFVSFAWSLCNFRKVIREYDINNSPSV